MHHTAHDVMQVDMTRICERDKNIWLYYFQTESLTGLTTLLPRKRCPNFCCSYWI